MPEASKITILLADEDALRRDGLASVLSQHDDFDVLKGAADGQEALERIRAERPHVAVVDLNLPAVHGIELVRRVRGEALGTKIIIMAGTDSDEIVREVVRAGADAYLLKNGPARHLTDAIWYVRDGGQYFSPQLKRDGRDRHLLEEPARTVPERGPADEFDAPRASAGRGSVRRAGRRRDSASLRDRLREEVPADLGDRDYEIMSMMADGIRPILDRLDEIDSRVGHMETGNEPVPQDPRAWLSTQLADTLGRRDVASNRGADDLEANLPAMIEEAVTRRFQQMAGKLQEEIEETHVRTLETFVKNVQTKLVQRVSALEQDISAQAQAMVQLQEYSQRTEDNLSRLISGVDKLAKDLPRRLAAAQIPVEAEPVVETEPRPAQSHRPAAVRRRRVEPSAALKKVWAAAAVLVVLAGAGWGVKTVFSRTETASAVNANAAAPSEKPKKGPADIPASTESRLQAAKECVERKEYPMAEDLYRQVIKAEPNNVEALQGLASVLYREDKMDEAATILDRIPKN